MTLSNAMCLTLGRTPWTDSNVAYEPLLFVCARALRGSDFPFFYLLSLLSFVLPQGSRPEILLEGRFFITFFVIRVDIETSTLIAKRDDCALSHALLSIGSGALMSTHDHVYLRYLPTYLPT